MAGTVIQKQSLLNIIKKQKKVSQKNYHILP